MAIFVLAHTVAIIENYTLIFVYMHTVYLLSLIISLSLLLLFVRLLTEGKKH